MSTAAGPTPLPMSGSSFARPSTVAADAKSLTGYPPLQSIVTQSAWTSSTADLAPSSGGFGATSGGAASGQESGYHFPFSASKQLAGGSASSQHDGSSNQMQQDHASLPNTSTSSSPYSLQASTSMSALPSSSTTDSGGGGGGGGGGGSGSGYFEQHQQQYLQQRSASGATGSSGNSGFLMTHRRVNTSANITTTQAPSSSSTQAYSSFAAPSPSGSGGGSQQSFLGGTLAPHPAAASRAVSHGPLRVHQFFPTTGEAGVPVTVLVTVEAQWARQVGLQIGREEGGGGGGTRFVLCFGATDVDARTERSIASTSDEDTSASGTTTTTTGSSPYNPTTPSSKDLDLTIIAHAPHYTGPALNHPHQGERVPVKVKVAFPQHANVATLDATMQTLASGLPVGEYNYWQVSPRGNLKRPGDELMANDHGLRRPASFPALSSTSGFTSVNQAPQQHGQVHNNSGQLSAIPRSQTASSRLNEDVNYANASQATARRPGGVSDNLGLNRMASAHDFRSSDNMSQVHGMLGAGESSYQAGGAGVPSASPASTNRTNSLGFSSGGALGSDMSRPSSEFHNMYGPGQGMSKQHEQTVSGYVPPQQQSSPHAPTPQLIRSSQLFPPSPAGGSTSVPSSFSGGPSSGGGHHYNASVSTSSSSSPPTDRSGLPIPSSQRASLELHGNIEDMAVGWSHDEWRARRRLVQFWRKQEGTTIHAICKPILPEQYVPNSVVVSCIFWDVTNECYITSVDIIYLLEALVASRFNVEEKNRIRRNLEGLKPRTISKVAKSKDDKLNKIHEEFFKLVMSFLDPKPRHIEKDIKIFPWRVLALALNKIISKYSAAPLVAAAAGGSGGMQQQQQFAQPSAGTPMLMSPMESQTQQGFSSPPSYFQMQQQRRQAPAGLNLDMGSTHAQFPPNSAPPSVQQYGGDMQQQQQQQQQSTQYQQQQQQQQPAQSLLYPAQSTGGGGNTPFSQSRGLSISGLFAGSPRKSFGTGGMPGSATFNFSDFVVSPVAFSQTPLQQAQSLAAGGGPGHMSSTGSQHGHYGGNSGGGAGGSHQQQQQQSGEDHHGHSGGLGMDLSGGSHGHGA